MTRHATSTLASEFSIMGVSFPGTRHSENSRRVKTNLTVFKERNVSGSVNCCDQSTVEWAGRRRLGIDGERELFQYSCLFFRNRVLHYVTSRRATRTHVQCIYRHVGYNFHQTIKIFQLLKLNFDRFLVGIALINTRFSENRLRECQCQELSEVLQQSSREPGC